MADHYRRILEGFFPCNGGCRCPMDTPRPSNSRAQRRLRRSRTLSRRGARATLKNLDRRTITREGEGF